MQLNLWLASCLALATASPVAVQYVQSPQSADHLGQQVHQQYRLVQQSAPAQQVQYVQQPQAAHAYSQQPTRQQYYAAQQAAAAEGPRLRPTAGVRHQAAAQEEELPEDYDPNPQYQFSFDVKDDQFTNYQNRKEQREGGKISGSYSVVDSDGFIRTVKYTADPLEGFKAQVTREPTDIVVKIPQPQPQVESAGPSRVQYVRPKAVAYAPAPQPQYVQAPQVQYVKAAPQPQPQQQQYETQYVQQPQAAPQAYAGLAHAARAQSQVQYTSASQYASPQYQTAKASGKASAIGYATQPAGGSVVYQAYQQ